MKTDNGKNGMTSHTPEHWLVPIDGSDHSIHALKLAISEAQARLTTPKLMLLNVQLPLPSDVTRFIDGGTIDEFHREAGERAVQAAKDLVEATGLAHSVHIVVGSVASTIVAFGSSNACTRIVMGTHGHSSVAAMIMGSVTTKVLHQSTLPVLLTK
ncbi:universal stress protein [Curvibacter sp. APW13]|uniref:universal stress protein n=1 Tax=Curvibacter sp. APW13 TaxID=3077236 RepID=UPI0028DEE5D2|nr:universal stress protein [Curvibacter sp. APW13]MDT8989295.1 universal stress protein [Curvibacter sp. APW13]